MNIKLNKRGFLWSCDNNTNIEKYIPLWIKIVVKFVKLLTIGQALAETNEHLGWNRNFTKNVWNDNLYWHARSSTKTSFFKHNTHMALCVCFWILLFGNSPTNTLRKAKRRSPYTKLFGYIIIEIVNNACESLPADITACWA